MLERLKRALDAATTELNRRSGLPNDLAAVPPVHGRRFDQVDLAALSAYVGRPVQAIEPMDALGTEATTMLGRHLQGRLRDAAAGRELEPGELLPGQNAVREQRLRDQGVPEEMIEQIRRRIGQQHAEHTRDGWTVIFADGNRAGVRLVAHGCEDAAEFDRLEHRWDAENGTDGHRPSETPLLAATVQRDTSGPYECYSLSGRLAARGAGHVALVTSARVSSRIQIALATVALRTVEA